MISHAAFHELRLRSFVAEEGIVGLTDWEFDDRVWIGEAVGFSEWLRLERSRRKLGSLALGEELSRGVWTKVLRKLRLPLRFGMSRKAIEAVMGAPHEVLRYRPGHESLQYRVGRSEPYKISCTVHRKRGLLYLVVTIPARREPQR